MNKFFQNLADRLEKIGPKKVILAAFLLRIVLAIPFRSGDLDQYAWWGIYARDFGFSGFYEFLNFGNYARPDYPPLAMMLFLWIRILWEGIFAVLWKINISIPIFPSNVIPWFETEGYFLLLKLPGLIADFGIGLLLLWYLRKKVGDKLALLGSSLYLFNPAAIYVSSMWGQVDGIVIFLGLLALILIEKRHLTLGFLAYTASVLIKPTMLMIAPIILYLLYKQKVRLTAFLKEASISALFGFLVAGYFTAGHPAFWLPNIYLFKFLKGAVTLPYIQVRAFNLWTLTTGYEFIEDSTSFLGIPLMWWALVISIIVFAVIAYHLARNGNYWGAAALFVFASFMFLPRAHERYLLPAIALMLPFVLKNKKALWVFVAITVLHLLNLYASWQVPASPLQQLITSDIFARFASLGFLVIFVWLLKFHSGSEIKRG